MNSLPVERVHLEQVMPLIREKLKSGQSVQLYPRGTSMLPMLREGVDSVILSPLPGKLKKYDIPLFQRKRGQFVLHRIVKVGETYTCIGDNQFVYEPGVQHEQIIAVVTAFFRKDRLVSVDSIGYKLYCRIWHYSRFLRRYYRAGKHWLRRHFG